jgi:Family of unknown function (DUF5317)
VFLFFVVVAGALAIAVLIGGDVRRLGAVRLEQPALLILAMALKVTVALLGLTALALAAVLARPLTLVAAGLLLAATWFNRRLPGARVFGLGLLSNLVVILSFGGRMPVLLPSDFAPAPGSAIPALRAGLDPLHLLLSHPYGLSFLGDVFVVPGLVGRASLVSVGDLLMAAGVAIFIIRFSQRSLAAGRMRPSPAK